jgi:hypothetical protein
MRMYINRGQGEFMRNRISLEDTLASVKSGDRRYDERCAEHARELLRTWIHDNGGQQRAGELLGVDQSTMSRAIDKDKQPTLKILLLLSKKTGWSLERILGLPEPYAHPAPLRLSESEVQRVAERVAEHVSRKVTPEPMPAVKVPPKKPTK